MAGLKNIVGGELKGYTELLDDARKEATGRMIAELRPKAQMPLLTSAFQPAPLQPAHQSFMSTEPAW